MGYCWLEPCAVKVARTVLRRGGGSNSFSLFDKYAPGVDGELWQSAKSRMEAVNSLNKGKYRSKPLRRIYIPKKNGKLRPLSIPTMYDRAMQALYALALDPIQEATADPNSYGFRIGRSCQDAMKQIQLMMASSKRPE